MSDPIQRLYRRPTTLGFMPKNNDRCKASKYHNNSNERENPNPSARCRVSPFISLNRLQTLNCMFDPINTGHRGCLSVAVWPRSRDRKGNNGYGRSPPLSHTRKPFPRHPIEASKQKGRRFGVEIMFAKRLKMKDYFKREKRANLYPRFLFSSSERVSD